MKRCKSADNIVSVNKAILLWLLTMIVCAWMWQHRWFILSFFYQSNQNILRLYIGYSKYATALKAFLDEQSFASDINFTTKRDSAITGNFEVTIVETGALIYSRRRTGGFCLNSNERHAFALHIEDALDSQ